MNWISASMLMFASSVGLYLLIRASHQAKMPESLNNLAMFALPVLIYLPIALNTPTRFALQWNEWAIIITQGAFLSYLGNRSSLRGMQLAPNPGYSLIISKSYVVFTTLVALFWFGARISVPSMIAIVLIIVCSALIIIERKSPALHRNTAWIWYTLAAFFCWGFLTLFSKYLYELGVPILTRLIYSMGIASILIALETKQKHIDLQKLSRLQVLILFGIGVLATAFNYFMQVGIDLAPNVGYVNAVNAASIGAVTLGAWLFFRDELTLRKMVGVVGVMVGLTLLFLT